MQSCNLKPWKFFVIPMVNLLLKKDAFCRKDQFVDAELVSSQDRPLIVHIARDK